MLSTTAIQTVASLLMMNFFGLQLRLIFYLGSRCSSLITRICLTNLSRQDGSSWRKATVSHTIALLASVSLTKHVPFVDKCAEAMAMRFRKINSFEDAKKKKKGRFREFGACICPCHDCLEGNDREIWECLVCRVPATEAYIEACLEQESKLAALWDAEPAGAEFEIDEVLSLTHLHESHHLVYEALEALGQAYAQDSALKPESDCSMEKGVEVCRAFSSFDSLGKTGIMGFTCSDSHCKRTD
jgi:hypothetical protein